MRPRNNPALGAPCSEKGDRSRHQFSPDHQNYHSSHHDNRRSSLPSRFGAGGGESGFESSSSSFLFGGRRVGVGFGVAGGGAVSSPSSIGSVTRQQQQQQQRQQQDFHHRQKRERGGRRAAAALESGSQDGSSRTGRTGRLAARATPLLTGRGAAAGVWHAVGAAPRAAFSHRANSESGSVLGGRETVEDDFRRGGGRGGAAAAATTMEANVELGGGPLADPTPLSGSVGIVMSRASLPLAREGSNGGRSSPFCSPSSSSSGFGSLGYGGRRRRGRDEDYGTGGSSDGSSGSSDELNVRGGSSSVSRGRPPSSTTKSIPAPMGLFGGGMGCARRFPRRDSSSSSNSSTSDSSSSGSSRRRRRSSKKDEEGWSVASGGRWAGPVREQRSLGNKTTTGVRAAGWGGGGGSSVGSGSFVGEAVGQHPAVFNGIGERGAAGGLHRRRLGREA